MQLLTARKQCGSTFDLKLEFDFSTMAGRHLQTIKTIKRVLFLPNNFRMEFSILVHCDRTR